jgi:taurine dioxygenase
MLISNIREDGRPIGSLPDGEMMFHSDGSYDEHPYRYTMLYALEVPSRGGNTLFADMYGAYKTLPDALRRRLSGARARHGYYAGRGVTPEIKATLAIGESTDSWVHPLFTVHEETGRPVLFANRLLTECIVGLPAAESDALLEALFDHAERRNGIYEHVWRPGDFVIWDNRCVNHARTDFPAGERRLLRRTTVQGVRPDAVRSPTAPKIA